MQSVPCDTGLFWPPERIEGKPVPVVLHVGDAVGQLQAPKENRGESTCR